MDYRGFFMLLTFICLPANATNFLLNNQINSNTCSVIEFFINYYISTNCETQNFNKFNNKNTLYILYDVNAVEGFNLRRDVFIRLATFVKALRKQKIYENSKLVLPPFSNLYHWHSRSIDQQQVFWNQFFDLESMKMYTDVIDIWEFFNEFNLQMGNKKQISIDEVYKLQNFENMFENGVFVDKFNKTVCNENNLRFRGNYFGYRNITDNSYSCIQFQGCAVLLKQLLNQYKPKFPKPIRTVLILNAETVLHDYWGNNEYWMARRSMRFNKELVKIANEFRLRYFNSTNNADKVQRPTLWTKEKSYRKAVGGDYLCGHLRRADFLYGREKTTPSLRSAAQQIKDKLRELGLSKVFISSDCTRDEFRTLKAHLARYTVKRFSPETSEQRAQIRDGGTAIIDQIICSHAKYFIGTFESTFTYRIYEEREILGFPKRTTFNTFCKHSDRTNCELNSEWPIVY